jgi:hypothetical protein
MSIRLLHTQQVTGHRFAQLVGWITDKVQRPQAIADGRRSATHMFSLGQSIRATLKALPSEQPLISQQFGIETESRIACRRHRQNWQRLMMAGKT